MLNTLKSDCRTQPARRREEMGDQDLTFEEFIKLMKVEQAAREEGLKIIGFKNFGGEIILYLKKIEEAGDNED